MIKCTCPHCNQETINNIPSLMKWSGWIAFSCSECKKGILAYYSVILKGVVEVQVAK